MLEPTSNSTTKVFGKFTLSDFTESTLHHTCISKISSGRMEILLSLVWIYFAAVCACTDESIFGSWAAERLQNIGKGYDDSCRVLEGGRAPRSLGTVVRKDVNLFLFQNDEKELLPDWLQYHAYLFGTKSLHIIDHNSTDLQVCKLLALYKHCGSTVTNYVGDFSGKRGVLSDHMHKYKSSFLIPLDADEFIAAQPGLFSPHLCAHKQQGGQCGAYQGMVCPVCADY